MPLVQDEVAQHDQPLRRHQRWVTDARDHRLCEIHPDVPLRVPAEHQAMNERQREVGPRGDHEVPAGLRRDVGPIEQRLRGGRVFHPDMSGGHGHQRLGLERLVRERSGLVDHLGPESPTPLKMAGGELRRRLGELPRAASIRARAAGSCGKRSGSISACREAHSSSEASCDAACVARPTTSLSAAASTEVSAQALAALREARHAQIQELPDCSPRTCVASQVSVCIWTQLAA